jgi:putative hemolysin
MVRSVRPRSPIRWPNGLPALLLEPYARGVALTITVVTLTYFSVVVGELVPKRLALLAPEGIASLMSRPMMILARITHPLVVVLSGSCSAILRLLGARRREEPPVTDDEIKVLMEQGAEAGVFHESEQEIVSNVLRLDEQRISAIMTPRRDMFVIDLEEDEELSGSHRRNRFRGWWCAATGSSTCSACSRPAIC